MNEFMFISLLLTLMYTQNVVLKNMFYTEN